MNRWRPRRRGHPRRGCRRRHLGGPHLRDAPSGGVLATLNHRATLRLRARGPAEAGWRPVEAVTERALDVPLVAEEGDTLRVRVPSRWDGLEGRVVCGRRGGAPKGSGALIACLE
jgi:hypothetical protein